MLSLLVLNGSAVRACVLHNVLLQEKPNTKPAFSAQNFTLMRRSLSQPARHLLPTLAHRTFFFGRLGIALAHANDTPDALSCMLANLFGFGSRRDVQPN
jgi:hypothetical protein